MGEGVAIGVGDNLKEDVHCVQKGGDSGVTAIIFSKLYWEESGSCLSVPGTRDSRTGKAVGFFFSPVGFNYRIHGGGLGLDFCPSPFVDSLLTTPTKLQPMTPRILP